MYNNSVEHFNMVMSFDNLTTVAPIILRFLSSNLPQFGISMGGQYVLNSIMLPYTWWEAA